MWIIGGIEDLEEEMSSILNVLSLGTNEAASAIWQLKIKI